MEPTCGSFTAALRQPTSEKYNDRETPASVCESRKKKLRGEFSIQRAPVSIMIEITPPKLLNSILLRSMKRKGPLLQGFLHI